MLPYSYTHVYVIFNKQIIVCYRRVIHEQKVAHNQIDFSKKSF